MWEQEETRKVNEGHDYYVAQYYGKWPFQRCLGFQEIASVLFSIGNAVPHVFYLTKRKDLIAPLEWRMRTIVLMGGWIYVFGWTCSAIFHSRDLPATEKMDYYSALLMIAFSVWASAVRIFGPFSRRPISLILLSIAISVGYLYHVYYMTFVRFDYGYNMKVGIGLGLVHNCLWIYFIARTRRRYQWKLFLSLVWTQMALLLEVFDFPPVWGIFDAHSLWHAVTIPVGFLWYSYTIDDANFEIKTSKHAQKIT